MSEPTIPANVIKALAACRATGKVNMMDRDGVAYLCEIRGDLEEADWLLNASAAEYMAALHTMGARRTAGE